MSPTPTQLAAALLVLTPALASAEGPWADHGALRVSANGRQLQHADGTPFFYLADTAWELATRMEFNSEVSDGRGIESYLDNRAAKGFNVIQAPVISPLTGPNGNNVRGQKITVGSSLDPNNLNEAYLQRVDAVLDAAAARGMYVALLPTWGSNVNSGLIDAAEAERYGQVLGARYKNRPNIIWTLGGDVVATGYENVWGAMAKGIANGVNGTTAATPDYSTTLMTFHPAGGRSSSGFANLGPWMDFNSIQTSHSDPKTGVSNYNPHFDRPAIDYGMSPAKPTINTEPPYETITIGLSNDPAAPRHGPYEVRLAAYWSVVGGAAGHTYGHNNIWQAYDTDHGYAPQFGASGAWEDALDAPGAGQMTAVKNLVLSRPYAELVRDNTLLANYGTLASGKNASSSVASRGDDYALFYSGNGSTLDVAMGKIAGATVQAWWYNPRTGAATEAGVFANSGTRSFDPPGTAGNDNDWVLVLSDANAGHTAPGTMIEQLAFRPLNEDFAYTHRFNKLTTNGSATVTAANGKVTFNSGITNGSHRATVASHRKDFNFFDQPLKLHLTGVTLAGTPGAGANSLFAVIGDGNGNEQALYPGVDLNNGLSFEIRSGAGGVQLAFLEVVNRSNANQYFTLESLPTDLQILLDGAHKKWKVIASGDNFANGQQVIEGTWSRLLESNLATYQLALGAYNAGAVGGATIAGVDGLSVTVVPEPATVGMLGLGGGVLLRRRRRTVAAGR